MRNFHDNYHNHVIFGIEACKQKYFHGNIFLQNYQENWRKMSLENLYVVLLHGIENILLICPLLYLYNAASTRHKLLEDTVGAVPLEIEAMNRIFWLLIIAVLLITLSSPLQVALLYAFNKYGHPWKRFFNEFCFKDKQSREFGVICEPEQNNNIPVSFIEISNDVCEAEDKRKGISTWIMIYLTP